MTYLSKYLYILIRTNSDYIVTSNYKLLCLKDFKVLFQRLEVLFRKISKYSFKTLK